jgi:pimeloyl-ACP methyl ester carboxylesterase
MLAPSPDLRERSAEIAGVAVLWREQPAPGGGPAPAPILYLHGVPTDGDDFLPFLASTGGIAPDLPGFGRSGKHSGFDYSIRGYADFLEAFVAEVGLERFSLVVHDWGAVGLALAQRMPARVTRLGVIDSVPLLAGYRWHPWARAWRTRMVGELAMGLLNRFMLRRELRRAVPVGGRPAANALADRAFARFDHGTQRAILRLYRSAPPERLAAAGLGLGELTCPALVVWGGRDPYVPASFAQAYADALGGPTEARVVEKAGHWPWLDEPDLVDVVAGFLRRGDDRP